MISSTCSSISSAPAETVPVIADYLPSHDLPSFCATTLSHLQQLSLINHYSIQFHKEYHYEQLLTQRITCEQYETLMSNCKTIEDTINYHVIKNLIVKTGVSQKELTQLKGELLIHHLNTTVVTRDVNLLNVFYLSFENQLDKPLGLLHTASFFTTLVADTPAKEKEVKLLNHLFSNMQRIVKRSADLTEYPN